MSSVLTVQDLTDFVLSELAPFDADYDIEAIVLELDDSYRLTGRNAEMSIADIPHTEFADVCRSHDTNYV